MKGYCKFTAIFLSCLSEKETSSSLQVNEKTGMDNSRTVSYRQHASNMSIIVKKAQETVFQVFDLSIFDIQINVL